MQTDFWDSVDHHIGADHLAETWMAHPRIRARINQRISGSAELWPLDWFQQTFAGRLPLSNSLSIGCGTGGLERDLVGRGVVERITGIDAVRGPVEFARSEAERAALAINYVVGDAREYLEMHASSFDAIFFHASLHHFDRLDELLALVSAALTPKGLLYLDEFIGPSMHEWSASRLLRPNLVYYTLPRRVRRVRIIRTPRNPADPTEAVCAGEIVGAVERHFRVLERRDYGGNLTSLLYPNLRRPEQADGPTREEFDAAIERLLNLEEGARRSFHAVMVCERP